jgi:S1-C subfamily serine protease
MKLRAVWFLWALLSSTAAAAPVQHHAARVPAEARRLSEAFSSVAERIGPSVVQVEVAVRGERGIGSGVVFSSDGAVLTNDHVVEGASSIAVRLHDGRVLPARLLGRDPATDLAVVKVSATGLRSVRFADSDAARVGEWVVAVGSPFGLGYSVTTGVLSAKGRGAVGANAVEDYLQTDASINPGNSGGPLVDLDGKVLGINTMIVGRGQGIGFAVPSNLARPVAEQLAATGRVKRAWIGVGIQDVTPELAPDLGARAGAGALVNDVAASGPGARGHLKPGDIVAAIDGKRLRDAQDLIREILSRDVGDSALLEVIRRGRRYATRVQLATRPGTPAVAAEAPAPRGIGLSLRQPTGESGRSEVTGVLVGSAADRAGLRAGDVVLSADGQKEPTIDDIVRAGQDGHVLLRIQRGAAAFYAALRTDGDVPPAR